MSEEPVVVMERVTRNWGEKEALHEVSFTVPDGSITGLLGPNGAGKSTAIRVLLGLLQPHGGRSTVYGEDSLTLSREVRQRIGYLSERPFPHGDLPVGVLVRWVSAFFQRWDQHRVDALMARMGVPADRSPDTMSVGERRKAELFLALAPDPDLLILDDPWLGIDAVVRHEVLALVLETAREQGKTVLFTSHALSDVEKIADRVILLDGARVRAEASLDDLKERTKRLLVTLPDGHQPSTLVIPGELTRTTEGRTVTVLTEAWSPALAERLRERGFEVDVEDLNLEALFLALAGTTSRVDGVSAGA